MKIRGIITTTVLILLLITISTTTAAALSCTCGDICANETGWWRDGGAFNASGTPIQAAVDNATACETICVAAGSYSENVNVAKRLTLAGDGAGVVTVTAASSSDRVFEATADYVNISGFNVSGATSYGKAGVYLGSNVDYCNISYNTASNNNNGIYLGSSSNNTLTNNTANLNAHCGIQLKYSSNYNTLVNNTAISNDYDGIRLAESSNDNTLANNTANSNDEYGIRLCSSDSNTLTGNTASNNEWDLYITGSDSTFTDNTLNGTTISFVYGGDVSLKGVGSPASDPAGQQTIGKFISAKDQSAGAWLFLNFSYSEADVSGLAESDLKVWKHNGTVWLEDGWNGSRYLDTAGNVVGVEITSFSVFAPAAPKIEANYIPPDPTNLANTTSNYWVNYTWSAGASNVTDSYNVSLNGGWTNGTANTFMNATVGPSGWANITVFAYNVSGTGTLSAGSVRDSLQAQLAPLENYVPPDPESLANTIGNYWVNYTWSAGTGGNATDSYNVSMNGGWTNGTANTFMNATVGPSGWANITVFAYNVSGTGTLSAGSVSDEVQAPPVVDTTPPTVTGNEPTGTDVPVTTQIHVTFSEAMDQASAQSAFSTSPTTTGIFSWSGNIMTYTPDPDLAFDTTYAVTIGTGARDLAGNNMDAEYSWQFTTQVTSSNIIQNPGFESGTSPWRFYTSGTGTFNVASPGFEGDNAAKLALYSDGANIQLYQIGVTLEPNTRYRFSFAGYSTTGHDVNVRLIKHDSPYTSYGLNFAANLGTNWQTFTTEFTTTGFTGTVNDGRLQFWLAPFVTPGDIYYIDDVRLEKVDIQDTTPPTVTGNEPTGTDVPVTTQIHVTFSEAMDQASAQSEFSTSPTTTGIFSWSGNIMTYTPDSDLAFDTIHTVIIGTGARDVAGNNMATEYSWQFTTAVPDTTPPTVTGNEPTGTDVPVTTQIHVTFSEAMDQASAQSAFSTSPTTTGIFSWNGNIMTYTPDPDLAFDTPYTVTIGTGARDLAGNNMDAEYSWQFTTQVTSSNIIQNPGFESGTSPWRFYTSGTGTFNVAAPGFEGDNAAKLALYSDGANIQLYQMGVTLEPNTLYRFSFAGYSTTGHDVNVRLIKHVSPYTSYGLNFAANLGTNWQTFSTEFTTTGFTGTVNDGRLQFWLAPFVTPGDIYYIDDVRLEKVS